MKKKSTLFTILFTALFFPLFAGASVYSQYVDSVQFDLYSGDGYRYGEWSASSTSPVSLESLDLVVGMGGGINQMMNTIVRSDSAECGLYDGSGNATVNVSTYASGICWGSAYYATITWTSLGSGKYLAHYDFTTPLLVGSGYSYRLRILGYYASTYPSIYFGDVNDVPYYVITEVSPVDSVTPVSPYAMTYANNPIQFSGTFFAGSQCYESLEFSVESLTQQSSIDVAPIVFNQCYFSDIQTYSVSRVLPYVGTYRYRVRLRAFDVASSTAWTSWSSFGLGSLSTSGYTASSSIPVIASSSPSFSAYSSLTDCARFGSTDSEVSNVFVNMCTSLLYGFPWGYVTRFIQILGSTSTSSLPTLSYTFGSSTPLVGSTFTFDLFTDYRMNKLATIYTDRGDGKNLWDIVNPFFTLMVWVLVVIYIVRELVGIELSGSDYGHSLEDYSDSYAYGRISRRGRMGFFERLRFGRKARRAVSRAGAPIKEI